MKMVCAAAVCCLWVSTIIAQVSTADSLPPSPLEAFAARPTASLKWSKIIGQLDSLGARAIVTALVVEDETSVPSVMRGIRVDLSHVGPVPSCDWKYTAWRIMCRREQAAIYIEEGRLKSVRAALREGSAELRPMEFISRYSVESSGWTATGLIVCGYQFVNRSPEDFAELLTQAISELNLKIMNDPTFNSILAYVAQTPAFLKSITNDLSEANLRWKSGPADFSFLEQACHLRDIEVEGYGVRIDRVLNDSNPSLTDIDGARLALERDYNSQEFPGALIAFTEARKANVSTLKKLRPEQLQRTGIFAGETITLKRLLAMMYDHDKSHRQECEELLRLITAKR